MWKDTREDRLNRYKQILQQCPELYRSAPGESDEAKIYENFTSGDSACNDFITEDAACEKSTYENGMSGNAEEKNVCEKKETYMIMFLRLPCMDLSAGS